MRIVRLHSDQDSESRFEDVEIELELTDYAPLAPPLYLARSTPANEFSFMRAPVGWSSDWHPSTGRNLFFVISGEWELIAGNGESRRFGVGDVLLVEDTEGKGHSSRVISETDSLAAIVRLATEVPTTLGRESVKGGSTETN